MDSITQALLGASVQASLLGRWQGRKALLYGAMLGTLVQQLAGVGSLAARRSAGINGGGQIVDRKTRHQLELNSRHRQDRALHSCGCSTSVTGSRQGSSRIGSPARTIWSLA